MSIKGDEFLTGVIAHMIKLRNDHYNLWGVSQLAQLNIINTKTTVWKWVLDIKFSNKQFLWNCPDTIAIESVLPMPYCGCWWPGALSMLTNIRPPVAPFTNMV